MGGYHSKKPDIFRDISCFSQFLSDNFAKIQLGVGGYQACPKIIGHFEFKHFPNEFIEGKLSDIVDDSDWSSCVALEVINFPSQLGVDLIWVRSWCNKNSEAHIYHYRGICVTTEFQSSAKQLDTDLWRFLKNELDPVWTHWIIEIIIFLVWIFIILLYCCYRYCSNKSSSQTNDADSLSSNQNKSLLIYLPLLFYYSFMMH